MKEARVSSERKVAVITGASQGIGAALVEAYRGRGYRVIAIARSIRRSDDTDILAVRGDIAALLGVTLAGFFHMTQLAIAEMEKRDSGHIVQITTSLIDHANSQIPSVLASLTKGGLGAATRSLAIEYAKRSIRVNAVAPGIIKTPMHRVETHDALGGLHPLGRMG